jgi:hypothetical protein
VSTPQAIRRVRDVLGAADQSDQSKAGVTARLNALGPSAAASAFWDFRLDDRGFTWIREYDPARHAVPFGGLESSGPGGRWNVFDRDGFYRATIEMPNDFELQSISGNLVVGIRRDAFDVESVRVYKLLRADP